MSQWLTPEEVERRKSRNKILLYTSIPVAVIGISALATFLANNI
ncbi:hypothetical protein V7138_13065 [Bacillus sp. JJ1533]